MSNAPASDRSGLRTLRRASQMGFLVLWTALFLFTRHQVAEVPPSLFLLTDPLVAVMTIGASHVWVAVMAWSVLLVVLTLILGRFFCGWVCPVGTLLDATAKFLRPGMDRFAPATHQSMQRIKYYLLAAMLVGALLGAQWVFVLDPLVMLYRAVTVGLYPFVAWLLPEGLPTPELRLQNPQVAALPLALLLAVIALVALAPRFYCRYLCPLGAFYGVAARFSLLRRRVSGCTACKEFEGERQCIRLCRMGAPGKKPQSVSDHECIRCLTDRAHCPGGAVGFAWVGPRLGKADMPLQLERRAFLATAAFGVGVAPMVGLAAHCRRDPRSILRPPRVLEEDVFLQQCVRCAMCVQACPTQTLRPLHLEAGFQGLWSPALTPRLGGCVKDCNACSRACPTGAIPAFDPTSASKWGVKMGTAVLSSDRCLSYREGLPCEKCVKACPTEAIAVLDPSAQSPRRPAGIDYMRCTGCGLCEHACYMVLFGEPAIQVFSHGRGQPTALPTV